VGTVYCFVLLFSFVFIRSRFICAVVGLFVLLKRGKSWVKSVFSCLVLKQGFYCLGQKRVITGDIRLTYVMIYHERT